MATSTDMRIPFRDVTLAGTLHTPEGPGPFPALVMLAGSGPDDRDAFGFFTPIREAMLAAGVAVLSWDKPGVGDSSGDWRDQTFADRASEAIAALARLREHPRIRPDRTGVWGHSQGGWIAQIVAASDPRIAFAIINSGPGTNAETQDLYGVEHTLRARGATEADIERAIAYMERLHTAAKAAMPHDRFVAEVMDPARGTAGFAYFGEVDAGLWGFLVRNMREPYDPVTALERITCPLLAIFGERDALVPVETSMDIFEAALARAGNEDVTIQVLPGADHRILTGDPPVPADGYLDTITAWLRERAT